MEKYNDTQTKSRLCAEVEAAIGRKLATPKDFDFLRNQIFSRLHIFISATTLKRIWGYLPDNVAPHRCRGAARPRRPHPPHLAARASV